jgi:hypothetical protein
MSFLQRRHINGIVAGSFFFGIGGIVGCFGMFK